MRQHDNSTTVRWIGHATCVIDLDGVRVLTDPVLRPRLGPLRRHGAPLEERWWRGTDVVVLSHLHHDHLDITSLRRLPAGVPVLAPQGARRVLRRTGLHDVIEVSPGDRVRVGAVTVEATPADHDDRRWRGPWGAVAPPVGYLIEGSTPVWFAGDTDAFPEMSQLRDRVDVALLPVGGWGLTLGTGHLDPRRAAEVLDVVRPRLAVPVHWGTLRPLGTRQLRRALFEQPGPLFRARAAELSPQVQVVVLRPGQAVRAQR